MLSHVSQITRCKKTARYALVVAFLAVFLYAVPASAQVDVGLEYAANIGLGTADVRDIIVNVIRVALGLLGLIAVIIILYGGFVFMTSGGDPTKVERGRKILINAGIGLVIVLAAFGITQFIIGTFFQPSQFALQDGEEPTGAGGALGGGIIQSHYPPRNAFNIPRNTSIVITFKEVMSVPQLIADANANGTLGDCVDAAGTPSCDKLITDPNNAVMRIFSNDINNGDPVEDVNALTEDGKTFVFRPAQLLGSQEFASTYVVELASTLQKATGQSAFGAFGSYAWQFEVSTVLDLTPPIVESVIPRPSNEPDNAVARNMIIQMNFSEPVNPITIAGIAPAFTNIETSSGGELIEGTYGFSNEYRTAEFVTNVPCGINSCGEQVFCLPANEEIDVLIKSATLMTGTDFVASFPFDGVVDMADNALDGNEDGQPQGNAEAFDANEEASISGDSYTWHFFTNDQIDLVPPQIIGYAPLAGEVGVNPVAPISATFDKLISSSTAKPDAGYGDGVCACSSDSECFAGESCVNSRCVESGEEPVTCTPTLPACVNGLDQCHQKEHVTLMNPPQDLPPFPEPVGYWITSSNNPDAQEGKITTNHAAFAEYARYGMEYGSGIKDMFQNCYIPSSAPGCMRQETEIPGQYAPVPGEWLPGEAQFPSCDLSGTSLSTAGIFNLSFVEDGEQDIFPFQAFSWDVPAATLYGFSAGASSIYEYGAFEDLPLENTVTFMVYFDETADQYYLVVIAGDPRVSSESPQSWEAVMTVTAAILPQAGDTDGEGNLINNQVFTVRDDLSLSSNDAFRYNFVSEEFSIVMNWASDNDGFVYRIGSDPNFEVLIDPQTDATNMRFVYPGGFMNLEAGESFSILRQ